MNINSIGNQLMNNNISMVQQTFNTGMLKKAMQSEAILMDKLLEALPDPDIGQNVDIVV